MSARVYEAVTDRLPAIGDELTAEILASPRTVEDHARLMAKAVAMGQVEVGGTASAASLPASPMIAAWNIERCLFPEATGQHLAPYAPDVVLLSEVDSGMARTGQRHTTAEVAKTLGMSFAFGVEFFEMGLGGETELQFCKDDRNTLGWHGNALLTKAAPDRVALIRLDTQGHWFCSPDADAGQPRIGGRMAIAAVIPTDSGPIVCVSVHLVSNALAPHRAAEFVMLMDAIDHFAPDLPVVIGGDLNTGNRMPDEDWRSETLFDEARARGYSWDALPEDTTTAPSVITPHPTRVMKLDWFAARGMTASEGEIFTQIGADGTPLSDHLPIIARFTRA